MIWWLVNGRARGCVIFNNSPVCCRLGGVTLPGGVGQSGDTSGTGNMVRDLVLCQVVRLVKDRAGHWSVSWQFAAAPILVLWIYCQLVDILPASFTLKCPAPPYWILDHLCWAFQFAHKYLCSVRIVSTCNIGAGLNSSVKNWHSGLVDTLPAWRYIASSQLHTKVSGAPATESLALTSTLLIELTTTTAFDRFSVVL